MEKTLQKHYRKTIVIMISLLIGINILTGCAITNTLTKRYFSRIDRRDNFSMLLTYDDVKADLPRREIAFFSGPNELVGAVYGNAETIGLVVIVHGHGGDMDTYIPVIKFLVQNNWSVMAYNGTGVNDSGGESRNNLFQAVPDLLAALLYIKNNVQLGNLPLVLFGHSQGGFAVCSVLNYAESANVKAVVSFAGMNRTKDIVDKYGRRAAGIFYPLLRPFLDDTDFTSGVNQSAINGINSTDIPIMLVQGAEDKTVLPDSEAITHFMDDILNTNVKTVILSDEWNSGHHSIFWSKDTYIYRNELNSSLELYREAHNIDVLTDNDLRSWAYENQLDRVRANGLNMCLFDQINKFLLNAIID